MSGPVIVYDDAIPHAAEALAGLGELHPIPAAMLDADAIARRGATCLLVRSVTRVDADLLARAPSLGFVGTATAGTDHLDLGALADRGVAVASSAGCNANAVAEWVVAALFVCHRDPFAQPFGVVGYGNVGRRLAAKLRALGIEVLACDPPLARAGATTEPLVSFDELWARCAIVSFHVPLITDGPDRTLAYVDADRPAVGPAKLLINTSRGPVIRERALDRPDVAAMILDVWDGEPDLAPHRLEDPRLLLASPHVAGYSLEAKIAGTRMMHEALCRHLGRAPSWTGVELLQPRTLDGPLGGYDRPAPLFDRICGLAIDDANVRALASLPSHARARRFEALRRDYALRREFDAWRIPPGMVGSPSLARTLAALGFGP